MNQSTLRLSDLERILEQCREPRHRARDIMMVSGIPMTPAMYLAVLRAMDIQVEVQGPFPVVLSAYMATDAVIVISGPPPSLEDMIICPSRMAFDWMDAEPPRSWGNRWTGILSAD